MENIRKPFQGVWNIIRFNWHYFVASIGFVLVLLLLNIFLHQSYHIYSYIFCLGIIATTLISLMVSFYVYDLSGLYRLEWLNHTLTGRPSTIVNIHAGFDEISSLLQIKFPDSRLWVFDFYDPSKHTEVSIKRARKAYPTFPTTQQVSTSRIPLEDDSTDNIFVMLSAHEIRNDEERKFFFMELKRILRQDGQIIVTEHLRDVRNFLAYNIGFLHFLAKYTWHKTFQDAKLKISQEIKITPFITTFFLEKHGVTS
jgi:SAM-dependent methyltransferase